MVDCKRVFIVTKRFNFDYSILGVYDSYVKAKERLDRERDYHVGEFGLEFNINVYEVL